MTDPRAVPDPNVLVAAAITPHGVCGRLVDAAIAGRWKPVASPQVLAELSEVLLREKFRRWLTVDDAEQFVAGIASIADVVDDPPPLDKAVSADPDDDYLIALALAEGVSALVSGDHHLTDLIDLVPPVMTPAAFLASLDEPTR